MAIGDIPKKIIGELGEAALSNLNPKEIEKALLDLDVGAAKVLKTFGASRDMIQSLRSNMADAVTSVSALGGNFGEVLDIQERISKTLGRNLILSSDSFEKMYATSKASGQEYETIVNSFKDVGVSVYESTKQMGEVVNIARASGVNANAVSAQVLSNMEALNKYNFEGGVQGLAKMAAQATSLRIDMRDTLAFAEKVFDPEGAIKMAASLQRLGVAQSELLDPLRLMDLAQNDPGELQNQIAKMSEQFVQLKKDGSGFEIMPGAKRQMREISMELFGNADQLSRMSLASADLSEKMKKIQFPSATEDQKMMIANMAEMKGGEYVVNFTDSKGNAVQDKKVTELSPDDIKALGEASKPKSMEELAKGQLTTLEKINASINTLGGRLPYAIAGSKIGKEAQEAPRDLYAAIEKTFSGESLKIKNLRKGIDENSDLVLGSLKKIATGEGSWGDISQTVKDISDNAKSFLKNVKSEMGDKVKEAGSNLTNSDNRLVKGAAEVANKVTQQVVKVEDFVIKTLPQDTLVMAGGTKLGDNQSQSNTNSTIDVNFTLKIESNQTIDEKQLAVMFENTGVKQKMIEVIKTGGFNNGLTGGNSSKQKQMIT